MSLCELIMFSIRGSNIFRRRNLKKNLPLYNLAIVHHHVVVTVITTGLLFSISMVTGYQNVQISYEP